MPHLSAAIIALGFWLLSCPETAGHCWDCGLLASLLLGQGQCFSQLSTSLIEVEDHIFFSQLNFNLSLEIFS